MSVPRHVRVRRGAALAGRGVEHRKVQLLLPRGQLQEQVLDHRFYLRHAGLGTVDLVDDDHRRYVLLEGLTQYVGGLGHGPVDGVDQQQASVGHIHDPFHLAAEIGVAGRVDDVDPDAAVGDRGVLGQDSNAPLPLQRVRVHNQGAHLLVGLEDLALLQQRVDQGRLAMVDVRYDGQVANVVVPMVTQSNHPNR